MQVYRGILFLGKVSLPMQVLSAFYQRQPVCMVNIHVRENDVIDISCFISKRVDLFIYGFSRREAWLACEIEKWHACLYWMSAYFAVPCCVHKDVTFGRLNEI